MKVVWLSNCALTTSKTSSTGTWLQSMSHELVKQGDIELCNITFGNTTTVIQQDCGVIKQWIVPITKLKNGLPKQFVIDAICNIVDSISPDLVHIWGVEYYWGLLSARGYIKYPILLEMQGLKYTCADVYYGGMSGREVLSSVRLLDLLFSYRRIDRQKLEHQNWGKYEREMLSFHKYISTQSDWIRSVIKPYCQKDATIFQTKMAVRKEFMESQSWQFNDKENGIQLLTVSSMATPYKGVHFVLRAVALLKKTYPEITLKIVGDYMQNRPDIYKTGYVKYIERLIDELNIRDNVVFAGSLSAPELVCEMHNSSVVVLSSFVESYSLALAESMAVGAPCVISYAGAMCELAEDGVSGLFYSPSDFRKCASQIERLIEDKTLAQSISANARKLALIRNKMESVVETQKHIYSEVVKSL